MLTIGSLFSGIGGLELGLERAGLGPVLWQVEIDPYCRAVLAKHWPDAERFDDVRNVGDNLPRVDLICGGFPCQDISNSGGRAGIGGERSGLWVEYLRLVRLLQPRFVVVENVAALLVRGIDRVLGDLAESGYDSEWDCISAASVGAHHLRDRLFVVAYPKQDRRIEHEGWAERGVLGIRPDPALRERAAQATISPDCGQGLLYADDGDESGSADADDRRTLPERPMLAERWFPQPGVDRVVDGVSVGLDRIAALGNAVVPQVAEVVGWVVRGIHERLVSV